MLEDFEGKRAWLDAPMMPPEPSPLSTHWQTSTVDDWMAASGGPYYGLSRPVFGIWKEEELPEKLKDIGRPISLAAARRTPRGELRARDFKLGTFFVDSGPDLMLQLVRLNLADMHASRPVTGTYRPGPSDEERAFLKRLRDGVASVYVLQRVDGSLSAPVGVGEETAVFHAKIGRPIHALVSWLVERPDGSIRPLKASDAPNFLRRRNAGIAETKKRILKAWGRDG